MTALFFHWRGGAPRFESVLDGIVALVILSATVFFYLSDKLNREKKFPGLQAVLFTLGLLRFLDSATDEMHPTVWLERLGSLGLATSLLVQGLRNRESSRVTKERLQYLIAFFTAALSIGVVAFPEFFPESIASDGFTPLVKTVARIAAVAFFLACLLWRRGDSELSAEENRAFFITGLLMGLGAVLFPFCTLWSASWWLVQGIELCAQSYFAVSLFLLHLHRMAELKQRLGASELRHRIVAEVASDAFWDWDMTRDYVTWNGSLKSAFGYDLVAAAGGSAWWKAHIHADDRARVSASLSKAVDAGADSWSDEYRFLRADGTPAWILDRAHILRDSQGRALRMIGSISDRTAEREAEQKLKESELRFHLVARAASHVMWERKLETDSLTWFDAVGDNFKYSLDQVGPSMSWWNERIHPEDRARVEQLIHNLHASGESFFALEYRFRRGDETYAEVITRGIVERDAQGKPVRLLGVMNDISERKRAEEALREKAELLDLSSDAIIVKDEQFRVCYWNRGAELMYGWTEEEAKGRLLDELLQTRLPRAPAIVLDELKKRGIWSGQLEQRKKGNLPISVITHWALFPARDGGWRVLQTNTDVTALKTAEQKLRDTAIKLKRSNEDLELFASLASHDMQEPLRMISSYLQLLERRYGASFDSDGKDYLQFALRGSERLRALIRSLLDYAKLTTKAKPFVCVEAKRVVEGALQGLKVAIEESGAVIEVSELPSVRGDAVQLGVLFQNLIANAIKYRKPSVRPHITIACEERAGEWVFKISDNGIGFDVSQSARLFEPFHRLHGKEYPGSGIGLAACKKIVERHAGRIWAESEINEGSSFYFSLGSSGEIPDQADEQHEPRARAEHVSPKEKVHLGQDHRIDEKQHVTHEQSHEAKGAPKQHLASLSQVSS